MKRRALVLLVAALPALAQAWPTFYSAYQDGLAAQARGNHALAIRAFRRAIVLNPQPGRDVRTYGLNFMSRYEPYLRLAASQLAVGDLPSAQASLGHSAALGLESAAERQALMARLQHLQQARAALPSQAPSVQPLQVQPSTPRPVQAAPTSGPVPGPLQPVPSPQPPPVPTQSPAPAPGARIRHPLPEHRPAALPSGPATAPATPPVQVKALQPAALASPTPVPGPSRPRSWLPGGLGLAVVGGILALLARRRSKPADSTGAEGGAETVGVSAPPLPVSRDPNLGQTFGRYVAHRVLGRGGCATAYYGVDVETGEEVAIKVPHPHLMDQPEARARFQREATLGSLLVHPNIVPVLEASSEGENPWLAMRYIPGDTLASRLVLAGPLGIPDAVALARDVAGAIRFAHERGVVHRDLKPANVMVTPAGALVMDFGIARLADGGLTATTLFLGTPQYAAPEAITSPRVGPPADWYALGIMLFEMLAGRAPFQADSTFNILEAHRSQPLPDLAAIRPMTPPPLESLIRRMCAKGPEQRPSGEEIVETLGRFAARSLAPAPEGAPGS